MKIDVVGEDKDLLDVSGTRSDLVTQTFDETADDKQKALLTSKWRYNRKLWIGGVKKATYPSV